MTEQGDNPVVQIPLDQIVIDPAYHRDAWREPQALRVSQRVDGTYALLDGYQRLEAMKRFGFTMAPCKVEELPDIQAEARRFVELNQMSGSKRSNLRLYVDTTIATGNGGTTTVSVGPFSSSRLAEQALVQFVGRENALGATIRNPRADAPN